jgi:hypothetical protein
LVFNKILIAYNESVNIIFFFLFFSMQYHGNNQLTLPLLFFMILARQTGWIAWVTIRFLPSIPPAGRDGR